MGPTRHYLGPVFAAGLVVAAMAATACVVTPSSLGTTQPLDRVCPPQDSVAAEHDDAALRTAPIGCGCSAQCCGSDESYETALTPQMIHGVDNRVLVRDGIPDVARGVSGAVVFLTSMSALDCPKNGGGCTFRDEAIRKYSELDPRYERSCDTKICSSEPFFHEDVVASRPWGCSGVMVAEGWVLTASHCAPAITGDSGEKLVAISGLESFDAVPRDHIHEAQSVIYREYWGHVDNIGRDLALIRVDVNAQDVQIAELSPDELEFGDSLFVIGHPRGLAATFAGCASVTEVRATSGRGTLDAVWGNSGTPVFDYLGRVVGIVAKTGPTVTLGSANSGGCCNFESHDGGSSRSRFSNIESVFHIVQWKTDSSHQK